jgi:hypothetical protein
VEDRLTPYKDLLAAFKRDCNEVSLVASLLRQQFPTALTGPIVDVGAGSGELASLAFDGLTTILVDQEGYPQPPDLNHTRITCDFAHLDLAPLKPNTILFCHSANYFLRGDPRTLGEKLVRSGVKAVLVVSNEPDGMVKEMADRLHSSGVHLEEPFHVPIPGMMLERKVRFIARLTGADFPVLARHVVRIIFDLDDRSADSLVERQLRSWIVSPRMDIAEAIYCYRPSP